MSNFKADDPVIAPRFVGPPLMDGVFIKRGTKKILTMGARNGVRHRLVSSRQLCRFCTVLFTAFRAGACGLREPRNGRSPALEHRYVS
jgi:hypothetical protein